MNAIAHSPRVLVIDADLSVCLGVRTLLEPYGYDCQSAVDSRSGLARVEEGGWDLVLAALSMPELGDWEIVEAIHRWAPTMPVILMAGRNDPVVAAGDRARRIRVIRKPFPLVTLTGAVVEALYANPA